MTSAPVPTSPDRGPRPSRRSLLPLHPFLAASAPILALLAHNVGQVRVAEGLRPLLASLAVAGLVLAVSFFVTRDPARAAPIAIVGILLILAYGQLYDTLKGIAPALGPWVRHRYLLPTLLVVGLVIAVRIVRARAPALINQSFRLFAAVAVVTPLLQLGGAWASSLRYSAKPEVSLSECELLVPEGQPHRDVYLIIMDAYERDDILRRIHGYDNSSFLEGLESMGFYVARGSMSNYANTELSMTSILNMDYIQSFPDAYDPSTQTRNGVVDLLQNNRLRRALKCLGYVDVSFETGAYWTEWRDADYFLERRAGPMADVRLIGRASRFEALFLDTTVARVVLDALRSEATSRIPGGLDPLAEHRDLVLFGLQQLSEVARLPSPKFVFIHIISPHPPLIFGPNGESRGLGEFESGGPAGEDETALLQAYSDQVTYINRRLLEGLGAILSDSPVTPIVVLQGDHGWADRSHEDKLSILNAYLLPGGGEDELYPTITPVNSFRLVLDHYFGAQLGHLMDVSYFSTDDLPFVFEEVSNTWSP